MEGRIVEFEGEIDSLEAAVQRELDRRSTSHFSDSPDSIGVAHAQIAAVRRALLVLAARLDERDVGPP